MDKVYDAGSDSDGAGTTNYKSDFLDSHVDGSFDLVLRRRAEKICISVCLSGQQVFEESLLYLYYFINIFSSSSHFDPPLLHGKCSL